MPPGKIKKANSCRAEELKLSGRGTSDNSSQRRKEAESLGDYREEDEQRLMG